MYHSRTVSSTESDVNIRLAKVWTAISRLSIIWKSNLSNKIKWNFFQAVAVLILLYRCTTCRLKKCIEKWSWWHLEFKNLLFFVTMLNIKRWSHLYKSKYQIHLKLPIKQINKGFHAQIYSLHYNHEVFPIMSKIILFQSWIHFLFISCFANSTTIYIYKSKVNKVGDSSWGQPESFLFISYYFPWILEF